MILKDSPEDAEMLVAEDFHRHDAGLAQGLEVRNVRLVARCMIAQLSTKRFMSRSEKPESLDLLLVAYSDRPR